jgi:hypothetical protein
MQQDHHGAVGWPHLGIRDVQHAGVNMFQRPPRVL